MGGGETRRGKPQRSVLQKSKRIMRGCYLRRPVPN